MFQEIFKNYKKSAIHSTLGRTLTSIMVVIFIAFMIIMVEYAIPSGDSKLIVKLGMSYVFVNILRAITTFYEDFSETKMEKDIAADYREKIFLKLQNMKQIEIDTLKAGDILENMINDTKEVSKYYIDGINRSYTAGVLRLIGTLAVLMYLNVPIILVAMLIYCIGFTIAFVFNKKSLQFTAQKRKINAEILNFSNEQINGFETIKSLEIQAQRMEQLKKLLKNYEVSVQQLEKNIRKYTCLYDYIVSFVLVATIVLSGIGALEGLFSYGILVILARYISSPKTYARWVIEGFQIRNVCRISYQKILEILEKQEENVEKGMDLDKVRNLEFQEVHFAYNENQTVLNGISFQVGVNEKVALIGRTGSGKTSLVNLLCRFYDLEQGQILINGENYKHYKIRSLRDKIGYIMQKVVIFDGTVFENINYAKKQISEEKMIAICQKLNLHDKIMTLENGYQTRINSETDLFSNGEKQLINFARVMVENPEIIILDEATASLSYKSEMLVRKATQEITKNKISFIIAHRLSTIKDCDKILLMADGKIIEQGKHDELMKKQGEYYKLINPERIKQ